MKKLNNGAVIIFQLLWIMLWSLPAGAMDIDEAPTSVTIDFLQDLYGPVDFDHQMHAESYACNACHHHTTGDGTQDNTCAKCHANSAAADDVSCSDCHQQNKTATVSHASPTEGTSYHIDKPGIKGALHLQCLGCHQTDDGPTGCQDCHAFSQAGRKRFAVRN